MNKEDKQIREHRQSHDARVYEMRREGKETHCLQLLQKRSHGVVVTVIANILARNRITSSKDLLVQLLVYLVEDSLKRGKPPSERSGIQLQLDLWNRQSSSLAL